MELIKIHNEKVYGLPNSVIASGYPMSTFEEPPSHLSIQLGKDGVDADLKRASRLGSVPSGTGHDCFLKGIIVQFDLTMSQAAHQQLKRYHFIDCVSSTSTMHRITSMNIKDQCNKYVSSRVIGDLNEMVKLYNEWSGFEYNNNHAKEFMLHYHCVKIESKKDLFQAIIYNIPSGFTLTGRWTTNYLQLKTIYNQRKNHKHEEWREFCEWCESLPYFKEFCIKE